MLRNSSFLSLFLSLFFVFTCQSDDDESEIFQNSVGSTIQLHFDGENDNSPSLAGGSYVVALKLPVEELQTFEGRSILGINVFVREVPDSASLVVYKGTARREPVELVTEKDISAELNGNQWNNLQLDEPVAIAGDDYWFALKFSHVDQLAVIGCDAGPANENGNWISGLLNESWIQFTADVNWNIRAVIE